VCRFLSFLFGTALLCLEPSLFPCHATVKTEEAYEKALVSVAMSRDTALWTKGVCPYDTVKLEAWITETSPPRVTLPGSLIGKAVPFSEMSFSTDSVGGLILLTTHNYVLNPSALTLLANEQSPPLSAIFIPLQILNECRVRALELPKTGQDLPVPDSYIQLALTVLPEDKASFQDVLETAFPEHLPSLFHLPDGSIYVQLERPQERYGCYIFDETLRQGLDWWCHLTERGRVEIHHIPFEKMLFPSKGLLAIEDQWMAYAWSQCFERLGHVPEEVILIHLDDHRDMGAPCVHQRLDGQLVDTLTGEVVDLTKPRSVESAILSGAIGKASILTPLLWTVPRVHVRHYCLRPHPHTTYRIEKELQPEGLLFLNGHRISIKCGAPSAPAEDFFEGYSSYVVSDNLDVVLGRLPSDVSILLHIDMDFFNNRFDGDADWKGGTGRHDLEVKGQEQLAKTFFDYMEQEGLSARVIDTCIGISPSFYPGEFWEPLVSSVLKRCQDQGLL